MTLIFMIINYNHGLTQMVDNQKPNVRHKNTSQSLTTTHNETTKNTTTTSTTAVHCQWRNNGVGKVGKVQGAPVCKGPRVPSKKIITVKCRHNYSHHRMFRCSIAAATPINVSLNLNSTDVKLVNQNDTPIHARNLVSRF